MHQRQFVLVRTRF